MWPGLASSHIFLCVLNNPVRLQKKATTFFKISKTIFTILQYRMKYNKRNTKN